MPFKIFMGYTQNAGLSYYRMIGFAKYLRKMKQVQVAYSKYDAKQDIQRWEIEALENKQVEADLRGLMGYADIGVFSRFHSFQGLAILHWLKAIYSKPLLMEADDNFFDLNADNPFYDKFSGDTDNKYIATKQLEDSNGIITSTEYLRSVFLKYNCNIWVIPNSVDFEIWDNLPEPKPRRQIKVGWMGASAHKGDLKLMRNIVKQFGKVKFYFVGGVEEAGKYLKAPNVVLHHKWVPINKYPAFIKKYGFDIGICPLRDTQFNRCKSNLKYLEFAAMKIPVVASDVEPYKKTIKDGVTGLLASEEDEWIGNLALLINNQEKRLDMGQKAYDFVRANFDAKKIAKQYLKVLKGVVKK